MLPVLLSLCAALPGPIGSEGPFVRPPIPLAPSVGSTFALASEGDLSVALFGSSTGSARLWVRTSDGRGLEWSATRQLNERTRGQLLTGPEGVRIAGDDVYVVYRQSGGSAFRWELFLVRSGDRGRTWSGPVRLDKGLPSGVGQVRRFRFLALDDPAGDHLYLLTQPTLDPSPSPVVTGETLFLLASHDGGRSFGPPLAVPSAAGAEVDEACLAAEGQEVHVLWADDRGASGGPNDLFHRWSRDGGSHWEGGEARVDDAPGAAVDARDPALAWDAGTLVAAWRDERTAAGRFELRASSAAHAAGDPTPPTFAASRRVGGYDPGLHQVFALGLRGQGEGFVLVWSDSRSGSGLWAARSLDAGASWLGEVPVLAGPVAVAPIRLAGAGNDLVVCAADGFFANVVGAVSRDLGASWSERLALRQGELVRRSPEIAWNARYANALHLSTDAPGGGDDELWVCGYRPQTLVPRGLEPGAASVCFELHGFDGAFPVALVLVAEERGGLRLPEDPLAGSPPRALGIAAGPLLERTLGEAASPLITTLDPSGRGVTLPAAAFLGPSLTLHFVAVSHDPNHHAWGEITDVVSRQVP